MKNYLAKRVYVLAVVFGVVFLALTLRLWYLQIAQGEVYQQKAQRQRLRKLRLSAPRGNIYDRKLRLLATSAPSYSLAVVPAEVKDPAALLVRLGQLVDIDTEKVASLLKAYRNSPAQLVIKPDLAFRTLAVIEEHKAFLPGVVIQQDYKRVYPYGSLAAHVLGRVGEISAAELKQHSGEGYAPGDYLGKTGIERQYEAVLRGTPGQRWVERDARGNILGVLGEKPPKPGADLILSLDIDVQRTLEQHLAGHRGAGVVLECNTGEVLASASWPTFNPADFVGGISAAKWKALIHNKHHPLQNRVSGGRYPPGSVIKPAIALCGLEAGVLPTNRTTVCKGYLQVGNRKFWCWRHSGHGRVDLTQAIAQSCNVFFYELGQDIGPKRMEQCLRKFGFDKRTGLDLPGEIKGHVPDIASFGRKWYGGDTVQLAIGQGYLLVTPLEVARFYAALANGGVLPVPHLLRAVRRPGEKAELVPVPKGQDLHLDPKALQRVRRGLWECVQGPKGTGHGVRLPGIEIAGKTGTAQDPPGQPHGWFASYAPFSTPRYATALIIERGRSGSKSAVPITKALYETLFHVKKKPPATSEAAEEQAHVATH